MVDERGPQACSGGAGTLLGPCSLGLGTKTLVRLGLTKQGAARNGKNSPQ